LVLRIAPPTDAVFVFYERDMMRQEPGIHGLLLRETSVPVARIVAFDDSHSVIPRDYVLMERLPGSSMTEAGRVDEDRVLRQVGDCLAQAHGLTAGRYGYLGEHAPMEPQATWLDAFRVMWRKLIDDVGAVGYYDADERRAMVALLENRLALFDRDGPSCLLHMDVWAQNILVDDDGLTGLVDWDRALWGDPEIEFAVLDYCGISQPAFWEGYGEPRDESSAARVRNVLYLLYEIQKYIVIRHGRGNDPVSAQRYKRQTMQIVRQLMRLP
jgi:aminoglycoside phosphotransferase (APT) family kinase protein